MVFLVLRRGREDLWVLEEGGELRKEAGELTVTSPCIISLLHLSRHPYFLAMTFKAKETSGMREKEAGAPPPRGMAVLWHDPGSKPGSAGKPQADHLSLLNLSFPVSNMDSWTGPLFLPPRNPRKLTANHPGGGRSEWSDVSVRCGGGCAHLVSREEGLLAPAEHPSGSCDYRAAETHRWTPSPGCSIQL
jgi:hypothetical protein